MLVVGAIKMAMALLVFVLLAYTQVPEGVSIDTLILGRLMLFCLGIILLTFGMADMVKGIKDDKGSS